MRNRDVVARTGLPKATASRLMQTLTELGYLRRIDQGSYVLGETSARPGRAMLDSLGLHRFAPYFQDLLGEPGAYACLAAYIAGGMVPVFRWSSEGAHVLSSGLCEDTASIAALKQLCFKFLFGNHVTATDPAEDITIRQLSTVMWCHQWEKATGQLVACTGVTHKLVGCFVLSLHVPQSGPPSVKRITNIGRHLLRAASAISSESLELRGGEHGDSSA